ncbi:hypothetical protein C6558_09240 [Ensifer sp. NM-2]|nr:hypothetical protein [Ensifer canadensis]PSS65546.1 hypothetical protein C6558_09240 [Ensifer sp. NM-2]
MAWSVPQRLSRSTPLYGRPRVFLVSEPLQRFVFTHFLTENRFAHFLEMLYAARKQNTISGSFSSRLSMYPLV